MATKRLLNENVSMLCFTMARGPRTTEQYGTPL